MRFAASFGIGFYPARLLADSRSAGSFPEIHKLLLVAAIFQLKLDTVQLVDHRQRDIRPSCLVFGLHFLHVHELTSCMGDARQVAMPRSYSRRNHRLSRSHDNSPANAAAFPAHGWTCSQTARLLAPADHWFAPTSRIDWAGSRSGSFNTWTRDSSQWITGLSVTGRASNSAVAGSVRCNG